MLFKLKPEWWKEACHEGSSGLSRGGMSTEGNEKAPGCKDNSKESSYVTLRLGVEPVGTASQKFIYPEPVNVSLSGNSLCWCYQNKVQWIKVSPIPRTDILVWRGKFGHRHTTENHVKMEAETGMILTQPRNSKDCQQPSGAGRNKESWFFPTGFWGSVGLPTPWLWTSSLQDCERRHFCPLNHLVCGTLYGNSNKLI